MSLIIGTAGHIDHGKTSLIKALTGMDTDRLKEEKARGISIDLGFAYMDLAKPHSFTFLKKGPDGDIGKEDLAGRLTRISIVDVPGHERFIKNMLAGATGIDLVLFTVAADDGIMPQTREHFDIMRLLGVKNGIFVITKVDLIDSGQINKVSTEIKKLIKDTCLNDLPIIQVSSKTGVGIDNLKKLILSETNKVLHRAEAGFFRLPIDRSFSIKGFGTVVTGTVASGSINKNEDVIIISKLSDENRKVKVRGIQSHCKDVSTVAAGQRAAINLSGISHTDIKRGDSLSSIDLDRVGRIFDVCFEFLLSMERPVKNNSTLKIYHMTEETTAQVYFAGIKQASGGIKTYGQIKLKEPLAMMRGDRFILRDPAVNATIGGGLVLLPFSNKRIAHVQFYNTLDSMDIKNILKSILSDNTFIERHTARLMLNITENKLKDITGSDEDIILIEGYFAEKQKIKQIEGHIIRIIGEYHNKRPADIGADEDFIIKEVTGLEPDLKKRRTILKAVSDSLISSGTIARAGNFFHLPEYKPAAKGKEKEIEDAIISICSNREFNPIKLDEIFQIPGKKDDKINMFQLLCKKGIVIKIAEDSYISKTKLDEAKEKLKRWTADKSTVKASEFRDLLGCGRKFAIELLEYFDKEKITLRTGDCRVLRRK